MLVMTFMYCTLRGGRARLVGFAFFGISGLIESHHVIKTIVHLDYFPGAVTATPFAIVGGLLLRAVASEWLHLRRQTLGGQPKAERKHASKCERSLNPTS